ncbi:hypothetical protein [Novosphingobium sp. KN65.2]|uniref:hypothetical protein n=1 Tax=Novosphingobium sp. KN65.2 TaxID=1478134 RepID=UPI0012E1E534|nr:hypothetical protein [Novosphingobium sp. KN65.2]
MPWTTQQVRNRMMALALAIGAEIDPEASERHRSLAGTIVMPFAQLLIAGTNCQRPLLFPEMVHLARESGLEVVLSRFDATRGVSFDILLQDRANILYGYAAWRGEGHDLWFIPRLEEGPYLRALPSGLVRGDAAPFLNPEDRRTGLIRTVDLPIFEAGF